MMKIIIKYLSFIIIYNMPVFCQDCDDGFIEINGFCFYKDDIAFLQQILDNSTETVNINFDDTTSSFWNTTIDGNEYQFANGNGIVEPLEIGIKEWEK